MKPYQTAWLEHWSDVFVQRGYSRYLTLVQFLASPEVWVERFNGAEGCRPLLPAQQLAASRADRDAHRNELVSAVEVLEREVSNLVCRNGQFVEPMKHHAHRR